MKEKWIKMSSWKGGLLQDTLQIKRNNYIFIYDFLQFIAFNMNIQLSTGVVHVFVVIAAAVTVVGTVFFFSFTSFFLAALFGMGNRFLPPLHTHNPYYCLWRAIFQNVSIMMVRFHNSIQFTQAYFVHTHTHIQGEEEKEEGTRKQMLPNWNENIYSLCATIDLCFVWIVNAFGVINASIISDNEIISILGSEWKRRREWAKWMRERETRKIRIQCQ